jgi:hypothetical protein
MEKIIENGGRYQYAKISKKIAKKAKKYFLALFHAFFAKMTLFDF